MPCDDSIKQWLTAGRPCRTEAEMRALYGAHCGPCRYRRGTACSQHPCPDAAFVVPTSRPSSVLYRAGEGCPLELW